MVLNAEQYLNHISSLLKVPLEKINRKRNPLNVEDNTVTSTILDLITKSNSSLTGSNSAEQAEIQQWIEFCIVYVAQIDSHHNVSTILNELNGTLSSRTYLVANKFTIADVLLYYMLSATMDILTFVEKEKYMNISRWFDNLQQDVTLRQKNKLINFSTNYLATQVPSRH